MVLKFRREARTSIEAVVGTAKMSVWEPTWNPRVGIFLKSRFVRFLIVQLGSDSVWLLGH